MRVVWFLPDKIFVVVFPNGLILPFSGTSISIAIGSVLCMLSYLFNEGAMLETVLLSLQIYHVVLIFRISYLLKQEINKNRMFDKRR